MAQSSERTAMQIIGLLDEGVSMSGSQSLEISLERIRDLLNGGFVHTQNIAAGSVTEEKLSQDVIDQLGGGGGGGSFPWPVLISGRYYGAKSILPVPNSLNVMSEVASQLSFTPVILPINVSIDRIGITISPGGATPGNIRLGLYAADTHGRPATRIVDGGAIAIPTDADDWYEATVDEDLAAGLYWIASYHDQTMTLETITAELSPLGHTSPYQSGGSKQAAFVIAPEDLAYGPLPVTITVADLDTSTEVRHAMVRINEIL